MTGVLAVLPRGEAIRNFVYSGALEQVGSCSDLTVASVIPNHEIRALLHERFDRVEELEDRRSNRVAGVLHDLIDVAHGRWLWSEASRERWRLRDQEAAGRLARSKLAMRRLVAESLATERRLAQLDVAYERVAGRFDVSPTEQGIIDRAEPQLVFNGSHVHGANASPLLVAARRRPIPTAAFVFSWDNLTSQGRVTPRYDAHLVWTEQIRRDLLRMYPSIDPSLVRVTGTPQFDPHFDDSLAWTRAKYAEVVGVDPKRPIVLYSTGMPNHMPGEPAIVEDLADRLSTLPSRPQLVVRLYAKDRTGRFGELQQRRGDICFPEVRWEPQWLTPLPADTPLWSNMLRHADVGINIASTVSLELCMFDRPVINVAYNPPTVPVSTLEFARYYRFDHYRPIVESGAIDVVFSPDGMTDAVQRALSRPDERRPQRTALLAEFFGDTLDGLSGNRVADALCELAMADLRPVMSS